MSCGLLMSKVHWFSSAVALIEAKRMWSWWRSRSLIESLWCCSCCTVSKSASRWSAMSSTWDISFAYTRAGLNLINVSILVPKWVISKFNVCRFWVFLCATWINIFWLASNFETWFSMLCISIWLKRPKMVPSVPPMAPMAARICLGSLLSVLLLSGVSWYVCESVLRICLFE